MLPPTVFLHHYPIWAFLASVRKNALFTDDLLLNATLVRESACFTDKVCESLKSMCTLIRLH